MFESFTVTLVVVVATDAYIVATTITTTITIIIIVIIITIMIHVFLPAYRLCDLVAVDCLVVSFGNGKFRIFL